MWEGRWQFTKAHEVEGLTNKGLNSFKLFSACPVVIQGLQELWRNMESQLCYFYIFFYFISFAYYMIQKNKGINIFIYIYIYMSGFARTYPQKSQLFVNFS